jgi:hypothetical protein
MCAVLLFAFTYMHNRTPDAQRERDRFWELTQREVGRPPLKADEQAELEALRRRVGERKADESTR